MPSLSNLSGRTVAFDERDEKEGKECTKKVERKLGGVIHR